MEIGIIGLPKSGKTTIFNSLTKGQAETDAYTPTALEPNLGVAKVPDRRLWELEAIFKPKRTIPAEVKYVNAAIPKGKGLSGELLAYLSQVDALIHVVRAFSDERVPHSEGSLDPRRDMAIMNLELAFSDLAILERRLKRIEDSLKGARSPERETLLGEQSLVARIKSALEKEVPVREQELSQEESKMIANYQFLTAKPLLVLLNIGEEQLSQASSLEADLHSHYPQFQFAAVCGKLEMELSQLSEAEASEFRSALSVKEEVTARIIKLSYDLLGLISFFTIVSGEVKAWTIPRNTPAPRAAGKIHSDMERGFIRAEVTSYDDLVKCGSLAEARKRGWLHLEGKSYTVQDGDVITFLFNV
ncbi:MAG TPA: redox-regulated ATPase YchF [Dehalococcoidia bacterium]|nr:redox-regulated ATPase YchF [Dehalococcoidia bacterium]